MNSDFFTFGIDHDIYKLTNPNPRKDVFFYARPSTPRRAFELGILALEELSARNLGINIHLAGWDVSDRNITFKHQSYGIISPNELSNIYNKCAVGLVLSLTNMSLLPPELIACGTIPVINVGDNNKMVFDNKFCRWSEAMPSQIADALENAIEESASNRLPTIISASVKNLNWETSKEKFLRIFEGQMKNPK
jgi:glycosyltransferase involved in cell wall biosynthesis